MRCAAAKRLAQGVETPEGQASLFFSWINLLLRIE
jgi:hypothetical protein